MPNLPSSGQLSMGAIADNQSSASRNNLSLKTQSEAFASGSEVAGSPTQTTARKNLEAAPFAISEFFNADFVSDIFSNISITTAGGGSDKNTVDGENLSIDFDTSVSGQFDVQLVDSSNNVDGTETVNDGETAVFSNLSLDAGTYTPRIRQGFASADGDTITHFDDISGDSTSVSPTSIQVDAAGESVSNVTVTPAVTSGVQVSSSVIASAVTAGDGGTISAVVSSISSQEHTMALSNVPGVLRFTSHHVGGPTGARNNETSSVDLNVSYNRAINDVASLDTSNNSKTQFNSGDTIRIQAVSEGIGSSTNMKIGFSTSNSNTAYSNTPTERTISDSRFVRDTELVDTSHTLTSGTSLVTFFPKANYTSGDTNVTAGSSFQVAPALSYSTPGNATINVNQTRTLDVSSVVGNNASVGISSSPSKGSGTNTATLSPGTANAVYTISYTGTANFSQTNNQTDSVTVRPTVSLSSNNNSPKGIASSYGSGLTPTGVSEPIITISTSTVGDTISATNFGSLPANFTKTGGGDGVSTFLAGKFSGGTAGDRTFTATVSGNSTTSAEASVTVAYGTYSNQIIQSVSPDSGDFRRGVTTLNVQWQARNVALVDIDLIGVSTGTSDTNFASDNDSLDDTSGDALENQSHSATISDVGVSNVGTYNIRVRDASDNVPSATTLSAINILDKEPTTPGAFNDSSGTYHGTLALDWSASSYRFQYQIFKSSGDADSSYSQLGSNQTGTSVNISETNGTTTNGPFYYKVRAINFAQGPLSTETSNFNSPVRLIVMPTLDANNNVPDPVSGVIFSTDNNSSSTSTTMAVSSKSDNTNLAFSYALSSNTANVSISNANTETPTISAGSGVGSVNVQLTVTGDPSQTFVHSADTITVNYFPKFTTITFTSGTIIQNTDNLSVTRLVWQGFDASSGFRIGVFDASSGGNEISSNGTIDVTGSTLTSGLSSGAGGLQNKNTEWLGNVNLGTISDSGTVFLRVTDLGEGGTIGQESVTISAFNLVSITAGPENTAEAALGGSGTPASKFFLGTLGNGVTLFNGAGGTGGAFNGNNKFFKFSDGGTISVGKVNGSGVISEFNAEANVPPLAPTGLSFSSVSTDRMTLNWTDNSSIEDEYYIFYKTGTSNDADFNDTAYSGNPLSANDTTEQVTGLSSGQSYSWAVYARNGSSYSDPLRGTQSTTAPTPSISVSPTNILDTNYSTITSGIQAASSFFTISGSNRSGNQIQLFHDDSAMNYDGDFRFRVTTDGSTPSTSTSGTTALANSGDITTNLGDADTIKIRFFKLFDSESAGDKEFQAKFQIASLGTQTSVITMTFRVSSFGGGFVCIDDTMKLNVGSDMSYIYDLKEGDKVLSHNFDTNKDELTEITKIFRVQHHVYSVKFTDSSEMILTDDHPMISVDGDLLSINNTKTFDNYNIEAEKVTIGDKIKSTNGFVVVDSITKLDELRDTYTVVNKNNNFYTNNILVHSEVKYIGVMTDYKIIDE